MLYQSLDSGLAARQLEAQSVISKCNLVAATSDLASNIAIDNSTTASTKITLSLSEKVKDCFRVSVVNRATGAVVALAAAPDLSVSQKISVTVNGTGLTDVSVQVIYSVQQ